MKNSVQFYEIRPTFKSWCFLSIWFSYHSSMIQTNYSRWKVGICNWWKKEFNIWTSWIQKKWMVKIAHTMSFTNRLHKKKEASYFYCSRACCWGPAPPKILPTSPSKLEIFFLLATTVTLSKAFLPPIGDTCKSHVNVHGHCDKIYHQLLATQVKFPRISLAIEAAHSLRHALESRPKTIGANFEHFWLFVGPNLLINAGTLTSGYY